ncbi:MAG TPA: 3-hydroxyacyl-CoA dehydrogenase family protein [Candidatus Dormibacteraeota bacterium]|nr:3-hydroxyacyl-CoA dehydrogenase family protein [Candidatus Dormibacteraeota bacterium]
MEIKTVCIVGAGTVGSQLAYQCALNGLPVYLTSRSQETIDKGVANATKLLRRRVEKGMLQESECEGALGRVTTTTDLAQAIADADIMVEAVAERLEVKEEIFRQADAAAPAHTILATTSSTIEIQKLAPLTGRPDRCINAHFFNPVLLMDLVEVVRGPQTSPETVDATMAFARHVGRFPVLVQKESYGFIVNRIIFTAIREALRLVDEGAATAQDIDEACTRGLNWPMGPVKLADFIGLDVIRDAWLLGQEEMKDDAWVPTAELGQHVAAGELGMKSGRGFLEHARK